MVPLVVVSGLQADEAATKNGPQLPWTNGVLILNKYHINI